MESSERFNIKVFLAFFGVILILNFYLFQGLFHALAFASITAGTFYPFHLKLRSKLKVSNEIASLITTLIITVVLVLPLIFIIFQVSKETVNLYSHIKAGLSVTQVREMFFGTGPVGSFIQDMADLLNIEVNLSDLYEKFLIKAQGYSGKVIGTVNGWVSDTLSFIFNFLIMLLASYSIFVDGDKLKEFVFKLSPLPYEQEQMILTKFSQMNYVTLVCNGIGGIIQGVLAGIGLWMCGFNAIFLWSTIMVILAFIPLLGISIITIPASLYLIATGKVTSGVLFFCYTGTMALFVENWFKPKFMGKRIKVNSLLLLFYIIAGMGTFGMAGIFYGPLVCIIFLTMVQLFQEYYLPKLN